MWFFLLHRSSLFFIQYVVGHDLKRYPGILIHSGNSGNFILPHYKSVMAVLMWIAYAEG